FLRFNAEAQTRTQRNSLAGFFIATGIFKGPAGVTCQTSHGFWFSKKSCLGFLCDLCDPALKKRPRKSKQNCSNFPVVVI
ncbi:MAG TPA: hypothetical protein VJ910_13990, partial [Desulfuromonadales bacterium]|nr:hypothetical protein [Desulfuromonadales bacterium]